MKAMPTFCGNQGELYPPLRKFRRARMEETMKGAASRGITGGETGPVRPRGAAQGTEELEKTLSIPTIPSFARKTRFVTARRARCIPRALQDRARGLYTGRQLLAKGG